MEVDLSTALSDHKRLWKVGAWIFGGVAALMLVAVIAVTVLLHSTRFHNYVLRTAQRKPARVSAPRCS